MLGDSVELRFILAIQGACGFHCGGLFPPSPTGVCLSFAEHSLELSIPLFHGSLTRIPETHGVLWPALSATASFLYDELQRKVSAPTLDFVCSSVDAASLDALLKDTNTFPRDIATVSMTETVQTAFNDPRRHYTVDLYDRQLIPIGSLRVYLEGDCRLLRDASDEAMLMYKARIGLL